MGSELSDGRFDELIAKSLVSNDGVVLGNEGYFLRLGYFFGEVEFKIVSKIIFECEGSDCVFDFGVSGTVTSGLGFGDELVVREDDFSPYFLFEHPPAQFLISYYNCRFRTAQLTFPWSGSFHLNFHQTL